MIGCKNSRPRRPGKRAPATGILETFGYIVHNSRADVATSNVTDVANSIINMLGTEAYHHSNT